MQRAVRGIGDRGRIRPKDWSGVARGLREEGIGGRPMLVTQHPVFRRFWYPVIPMEDLAAGPKPFTLLGTKLVLWLDADGKPAAALDRCCHRTARLSRGFCENGTIVCGYHGW